MSSEGEIIEGILNGTTRIRRFTYEEQVGSSDSADRLLWLGILRAESELAEIDRRGVCRRAGSSARGSSAPSRFLKGISIPLPSSFSALSADLGNFEDRGQESAVFDGQDGYVYKIRPMRPSPLSGYLAPLANIIYHNRLFPGERYVLETIYCEHERFYMVLKQPRVEILLDSAGYPVRASQEQIRAAMSALNIGLHECPRHVEGDVMNGGWDPTSSSTTDAFRIEHLRFYNSDYYISDLQPGRNTVIDAHTGKLRFIDPRITLNDPSGPCTPVSRFGKRHESCPGQDVELEEQSLLCYADDPMSEDE